MVFIWFKKSCKLIFSSFWVNKSRRVKGNEREGIRKKMVRRRFIFWKRIFFPNFITISNDITSSENCKIFYFIMRRSLRR